MPDDPWLNYDQQAARLGVARDTVNQYVQRYGPGHANPYPVHVPGQHRKFGRSTAVLASALDAWNARRPRGTRGATPPGMTRTEHQGLAGIPDGVIPAPPVVAAMLRGGLAVVTEQAGLELTEAGRRVLADYPTTRTADS